MKTVEQALVLWGLDEASVSLVAARENAVYSVDHTSGCFALRLHRLGYRTDSQLIAELDWMAMLDEAGISVPAPIPSLAGSHLRHVDGIQVDVLTWLEGETLVEALPLLKPDTRRDVFRRLGQTMARLHDASDQWSGAATCDRPAWSAAGLLGDDPLWDRFWENPSLSDDQKALMLEFRAKATEELTDISPTLDYGLIHADLVPFNIMWSGNTVHLIDFDDGGFGFRLFEIATALLKHKSEPDFSALCHALIDGYTSNRHIDTNHCSWRFELRPMWVGVSLVPKKMKPAAATPDSLRRLMRRFPPISTRNGRDTREERQFGVHLNIGLHGPCEFRVGAMAMCAFGG